MALRASLESGVILHLPFLGTGPLSMNDKLLANQINRAKLFVICKIRSANKQFFDIGKD